MNLVEKLLSEKTQQHVLPGHIVIVNVDKVLLQDGTGPLAIRQFMAMNKSNIALKNPPIFFLDHAAPCPRKELANDHAFIRKFCTKYGCIVSDIGEGVCHQIMTEKYTQPGDILLGSDSHTCTGGALCAFASGMGSTDIASCMATGKTWLKVPYSIQIVLSGELKHQVMAKDLILKLITKIGAAGATYKALEFSGNSVKSLSMPERLTISNMAVEAGAKVGLFPSDEITANYLEKLGRKNTFKSIQPDKDATYETQVNLNLSEIEPMVSTPHAVDTAKPAKDLSSIKIDQVFIGTCTNGRIGDLRACVDIIKDKKKHNNVRVIVAPASKQILLHAIKEGIIEKLVEFGATIISPGCGPCVGIHSGILADGEVCISTANRNFKGRMGNTEAFIYLASPKTAIASAITGHIRDPRTVVS